MKKTAKRRGRDPQTHVVGVRAIVYKSRAAERGAPTQRYTYPAITLCGAWLRKLGIDIGDEVRPEPHRNGLLLRKL